MFTFFIIASSVLCVNLSGPNYTECEKAVLVYKKKGRFNLVGLVPPQSKTFGFLAAEVVKFAIDEVNNNLLSDVQLGIELYDICGDWKFSVTTQSVLELLLPSMSNQSVNCVCQNFNINSHVIGIVESLVSSNSKHVSDLLSGTNFPIISGTATSIQLSNLNRHPNFLRTVPPDTVFINALLDFVLQFKWSFVSIIASDDAYGLDGKKLVVELFNKHGICIDIDHTFHVPYEEKEFVNIVEVLLKKQPNNTSNVVILYALDNAVRDLLKTAGKIGLYGVTWIISEGSGMSTWYKYIHPKVIFGAFAFGHDAGPYPEFKQHLKSIFQAQNKSVFLRIYIDKYNIKTASEFISLFQSSMSYAAFIRNSVHSYAFALRKYIDSVCISTESKCELEPFNLTLFAKEVLPNINFPGLLNETVGFNKNGDVENSRFILFHVSRKNNVVNQHAVGVWSKYSGFKFHRKIIWASGSEKPPASHCSEICKPGFYPVLNVGKQCCWVCVKCDTGSVKPLYGKGRCEKCPDKITNGNQTLCVQFRLLHHTDFPLFKYVAFGLTAVAILVSLFILASLFIFRNTPIIKGCNFKLSSMQVIAEMTLFITLNMMLYEENPYFCVIVFFANSWLIVFTLSVMLVKSEQLVRIFNSKVRITSRDIRVMKAVSSVTLFFTSMVEICLTAALLVIVRVKVTTTYYLNDLTKELGCDLTIYVLVQSLYNIILILIIGCTAFRCRKLPGKYNDAHSILYALFFMTLFIVLAIPFRMSAPNGYWKVFVLYLLIYGANFSNLCFGYAYKVWIAWQEPNKNTEIVFKASILKNVRNDVNRRIQRNQNSNSSCKALSDV